MMPVTSWKTLSYLALALLLGLTLACGSGAPQDRPPDIRYGKDICDECRMIINEPRFSAGYITAKGAVRRFDDIGDLLAYHAKHGEEVSAFWVHDYETEEWIRAESSVFVVADPARLPTPMGHGVVAFADRKRAEAFARQVGGEVLTWQDLLARAGPEGLGGHSHGGHGEGMHSGEMQREGMGR